MKFIKFFEAFGRNTNLSNEEILDEIKYISQEISDIDEYGVDIKIVNKSFTFRDKNTNEIKEGPLLDIEIFNTLPSDYNKENISKELNWSYQLRAKSGKYYSNYTKFITHLESFCRENGLSVCIGKSYSGSMKSKQYIEITIIPDGYIGGITEEKELPEKWFEENPNNYVVKNNRKKEDYQKGSKMSSYKKECLQEMDWSEIIIRNNDGDFFECLYRNKELSLSDIYLMSFCVIRKSYEDSRNEFNRIHTRSSLTYEFRGLGIGYKCYKAVINKIGYASSDEFGTNENSRNIWKNLIKDKDYYSFETNKEVWTNARTDGFMVFKKSMDKKEIQKILDEFESSGGKIITKDPQWQ